MHPIKIFAWIAAVVSLAFPGVAQVTYTDNFSAPHNYLSNGVAGTMWDGIYLGVGEIANPMGVWVAPGSVSVADAGISSNGTLTIASLQTDWENDSDDGFFLYKIVTGDFDMSVQVVGPIDTRAHHFPGLMVRAFGAGGSPWPNGKENYFLWGRFDEYSIANMLKNETNGVKRDLRQGTFPNSNYWLRIQRVGNVFNVSEKASQSAEWSQVGSVTRNDFTNTPLQVGIEHAVYDGGRTLKAAYKNFSLVVSNMGPFATVPQSVTGLESKAAGANARTFTWTPGKGSVGSVVTMWTGSPLLKQAPANGMTYHGDASFGAGDALPATNNFVVYSGAENKVTISHIPEDTLAHVAVFSYAGSGTNTAYSDQPAVTTIPAK